MKNKNEHIKNDLVKMMTENYYKDSNEQDCNEPDCCDEVCEVNYSRQQNKIDWKGIEDYKTKKSNPGVWKNAPGKTIDWLPEKNQAMFGKFKAEKKEEIDWHAKYLNSQRELMNEAVRWGNRMQELELAYTEKINRLEEKYTETLEKGYEEAYHLMMEERQQNEKVAEQGYEEAYKIIQNLQTTNENLTKQLKQTTLEADVAKTTLTKLVELEKEMAWEKETRSNMG